MPISDRTPNLKELPLPSTGKLILLLIGSVATVEILVMLLLHRRPGITLLSSIVIDTTAISLAMLPILYFFFHKPLTARVRQAERTEQELKELSRRLEEVVHDRTAELTREISVGHVHAQALADREKELERSMQTMAILNQLLFLSLEKIPLHHILERFLTLITAFPWFELEPKGAVFLKDKASDTLLMICQRDLAPALLGHCARVPFGTCLCGLAAQSGEIVYAREVDTRHHIHYEGMCNHGHYCVPIHSQTRELLGMFTLYLRHGQQREPIIEETLLAAAGVAGSIIEHRRAAELLEYERDRNQQYLDIMGTMMVALDPQGTITLINRPGSAILEYEEHELLGKNWFTTCLPPETREEARDIFLKFMGARASTSLATHESTVLTKTGGHRLLLFRNTLINDQAGKVTGMLFSGTDITERQEAAAEREALQSQLRQAQKMEAIGTLAGGIAHDFNNILTAILGYSEMAKDGFALNSTAQEDLNQVILASKRARDLIRHILTFSRQVEQNRVPMQMGPILKEAIKLLRASIPANIAIRQSIYPETGDVLADPVQIHQVLMNLCTNAAHAMADKDGILEIRLEEMVLTEADMVALPGIEPGPHARLQVSDTGHGLDRETGKRIFEPYFTTKPTGKGTGLGLSVVHGIVKSYKGAISVASDPGHGTVFSVFIPQVETTAIPEQVPEDAAPTGTELVLVVDDEPTITSLIDKILSKLGYRVITKTDSVEALHAFAADPLGFDLIITDQAMPELTGAALAKEILRRRPDIPIILCTGYSETMSEASAKQIGIREYILKPILRIDLARTVRKVLDHRMVSGQNGPDSGP